MVRFPVYNIICSSKETKKKLEKNSDVVPNHLQRLEAKPVMSREEVVRNNLKCACRKNEKNYSPKTMTVLAAIHSNFFMLSQASICSKLTGMYILRLL